MATQTDTFQLPSSAVMSYAINRPGYDGPIILLSNPLCTTFEIWDHVIPYLTALGFNVVRYNAPGHGESGAPANNLSLTTMDSLAEDVRYLLDHLEIETLHAWIGVSLGAATAIHFAAKYPRIVERLIACDTISCSPINEGAVDYFTPRIVAVRRAGNLDEYIQETLDRWFGRPWLDANPREADRVRNLMQDVSLDGFVTCCSALQNQSFDLRAWAVGTGSHVEAAMLLVGEKDTALFRNMEDLRKDIEGGLRNKKGDDNVSVRLEVVLNGGHLCFIDGLDSFLRIINHFLTNN
ncbi:alpha/beta-hydrolase [Xylaria digitata]|nr:alpha/beta-hydrolase [Xylaria digitata]